MVHHRRQVGLGWKIAAFAAYLLGVYWRLNVMRKIVALEEQI